ncbi:MAG TPA: hypothetical protein VKI44_16770 [Acetobacteraceae bacterium]|nr:hypothetical protein [Acetobacteraceae bacterium]
MLHFGGRPNEVDAFTFSNSLIALSEALQEINRQTNPDFAIEIAIEGVGPGSFRATIKATLKSLGGLFKRSGEGIVVGVLAILIGQRLFPDSAKITVDESMVVIENGHDKIIILRAVWNAKEKLPDPRQVERHIGRAFATLDDDPSITEFGLLGHITDEAPVAIIPRATFPLLAAPETIEPTGNRRYRDERTKLTVLRAILERSTRRWQFVWQGIRIAAPIRNQTFFEKLASREYWFAQGDLLDFMLRIHQVRDDISNVFINESYEVLEVYGVQHIDRQPRLPEH